MYDPKNWYWIVGNDESQLYSGATLSYISSSDSDYQNWLNEGNLPSRISSSDFPSMEASLYLGRPVNITSTLNTSIDGPYDIDQISIQNLNAVMVYILANNKFPASQIQFPWVDAAGTPHMIPDTATFKEFATAIADYVANLKLYGGSGGALGVLPSSNSIAMA